MSDPGRRRFYRGDNRTKVATKEGKQVLSSDVRLHLEKLKARKRTIEVVQTTSREEDEDEELEKLEKERRILECKLEK